MTVERARAVARAKPWGVGDLHPWSDVKHGPERVGEVSFERAGEMAPAPWLLLKLLFTSAPLSIQVHPDDEYANAVGLPNGKSEAWYVLEADPGAKVALGLSKALTRHELRQAIDDSSIEHLVSWLAAKADDAFSVPAGTIHAIGSGIVLAEIQQRSDATFRLFDHGRERALHKTEGATVAHITSAVPRASPKPLSKERLLLVSNAHFVFERIILTPSANWQLEAERETWLLVINGDVAVGAYNLAQGNAIFAQGQSVHLQAGVFGVTCLVAYTGLGGPNPKLLDRIEARMEPNLPQFDNASSPPRLIGLSQ